MICYQIMIKINKLIVKIKFLIFIILKKLENTKQYFDYIKYCLYN